MCGPRFTVNFSIRVGSGMGPRNKSAGPTGRIGDFAGCLIQNAVVERLEANADILSFHVHLPMRKSQGTAGRPTIPKKTPRGRPPLPFPVSRERAAPACVETRIRKRVFQS